MTSVAVTSFIRRRWPLAAILLVGAYLAFANLGAASFWDDEAHVAIMARNLLKSGHLTGWDGRNLFAYRNGGALDEKLRPINAPLDILTCAASFKAFGETTRAGRFPFVVIGFLGIILAALVAEEDGASPRRMGLFTAALLALSPWYLLYIRQCRYYSISMTASLLAFLAYQRALKTGKPGYFALFAIASALSFYANPLLCGAFLFAMACCHLAFHGQAGRGMIRPFGAAAVAFALLTVPYAVIHKIWVRPDHPPSSEPWLRHHLALIWWNIRDLNTTTPMPWAIAAAVVAMGVLRWRRGDRKPVVLKYALLVLAYIAFLSCFSPQPTTSDDIAEVRYLVPIMPFLAIMTASLLAWISRWNRLASLALLAVIVCTNLLTLTPHNTNGRWLLPAYVGEIRNPYPTSVSEAVDFLKLNTKPDDKIFAVPDYLNYPIAFYIGDRIRVCCVLKKDTHLSSGMVSRLDAPLAVDRNSPDWLLAFGKTSMAANALEYFSRPHTENGIEVRNQYKEFARLHTNWFQSQRPELHWHTFGPRKDFAESDDVYVYKLTGSPK